VFNHLRRSEPGRGGRWANGSLGPKRGSDYENLFDYGCKADPGAHNERLSSELIRIDNLDLGLGTEIPDYRVLPLL
jgi:hypothetical protein